MKTIVKVIATIAVFGGGFFAYQSVNAADITGDAGVSYSDTRTFRGVKQADDTLGVNSSCWRNFLVFDCDLMDT